MTTKSVALTVKIPLDIKKRLEFIRKKENVQSLKKNLFLIASKIRRMFREKKTEYYDSFEKIEDYYVSRVYNNEVETICLAITQGTFNEIATQFEGSEYTDVHVKLFSYAAKDVVERYELIDEPLNFNLNVKASKNIIYVT